MRWLSGSVGGGGRGRVLVVRAAVVDGSCPLRVVVFAADSARHAGIEVYYDR